MQDQEKRYRFYESLTAACPACRVECDFHTGGRCLTVREILFRFREERQHNPKAGKFLFYCEGCRHPFRSDQWIAINGVRSEA
jgi:hypothetical protein